MAHAAPPPTGRQQHQTDFGPSFQREVPVPPRSYIAPPPLAPYVTAEKRIHPPRIPSWGTGPDPGVARYHSNPHPHRPPPIHNPPRAGTWRRNVDQEQQETHMRSPSFPHRTHAFPRQGGASHHPYHPPSEHSSRPGSAASSSRPQLPPFSSLPHHASMQRSISHGSHHSVISSSSRHEISPIRPSSGESSGEGRMDQYGDQQQPLPKFERKRRTRALMTRPQIAALRDLWRATKFPGNLEREQVGSQIGLTPRQVQVWFQNQRQKARKEIDTSAIPDGAHPQDYTDLDKSPRSRRLSMEAHGAAGHTSHGTADSVTGSEQSLLSNHPGGFGLGIHTPQDDARSVTASSSKSGHGLQAVSSYGNKEPAHTSAPAALWNSQRRSPLNTADQDPFAFHKMSPVSARAPSPLHPHPAFTSRPTLQQHHRGDGLPSVPLPQQSPTYPTRPFGHSQGQAHGLLAHPPPMRHAATIDGELYNRRRSNSFEGARSHPQPQRDSTSPPRVGNRTRTHTTSELPPSLASLVLAGPVGASKQSKALPHFASDQRAPTLPPPRGWTPTSDRPDSLPSNHGHGHGQGQPSSFRPSQLPGVRDMFGPADPAAHRR